MTPEEEIRQAGAAQRIIEEPLFKKAREDVYAQLRASRIGAATTDTALHSKLILMEQIADRFFGYFDAIAKSGKLAQLNIDEMERHRQGFRERMMAYARFGREGI